MISSSRQESIGDSEDEAIGGYTEPFFDSPVFDESSPPRPFLTPPTTTLTVLPCQHTQNFSGDDIQFPSPMNDYDPSDYDAPNELASFLMFTIKSDYMSPQFSPNNRCILSPFDHSPPSSNASEIKITITPILTILGAPDFHL